MSEKSPTLKTFGSCGRFCATLSLKRSFYLRVARSSRRWKRFSPRMTRLALAVVLILSRNALAQSKESAMTYHTSYRTVKVDGLSVFYREAGPKDAPTILLLHRLRLPSSSRMFEPLLKRLAG